MTPKKLCLIYFSSKKYLTRIQVNDRLQKRMYSSVCGEGGCVGVYMDVCGGVCGKGCRCASVRLRVHVYEYVCVYRTFSLHTARTALKPKSKSFTKRPIVLGLKTFHPRPSKVLAAKSIYPFLPFKPR